MHPEYVLQSCYQLWMPVGASITFRASNLRIFNDNTIAIIIGKPSGTATTTIIIPNIPAVTKSWIQTYININYTGSYSHTTESGGGGHGDRHWDSSMAMA
jgi:hypothetical protein